MFVKCFLHWSCGGFPSFALGNVCGSKKQKEQEQNKCHVCSRSEHYVVEHNHRLVHLSYPSDIQYKRHQVTDGHFDPGMEG